MAWRIGVDGTRYNVVQVADTGDARIITKDVHPDDAERIVCAVNAHDGLVAALQAIARGGVIVYNGDETSALKRAAREALRAETMDSYEARAKVERPQAPPVPSRSALAAYLGDGVYADFDGFGIVLTTEDGIEVTNRIVLEPETLANFTRWLARLPQRLEGRP